MPHRASQKINLTIIDVAVALPVDKTFTYNVPADLSHQVGIGKRVLVPFGRKVVTGFCLGFKENPDIKGIKDVLDVLDEAPLFDENKLKFFKWMASYYFANIGEVLSLICPGGANIKSHRRFYAIEQNNINQNANLSAIDIKILNAISETKGITFASLMKIFKGKSIYSALSGLKQAGLIREEVNIKSRIGEKTETFVSLLQDATPKSRLLSESPVQSKIIAYLSKKGETSLKFLRKEIGGIDSAIKKLEQKKIVSLTRKRVYRDPIEDMVPQAVSHKPTDEQQMAISAISHGLKSKAFSPYLLYGVTGSGKTFVYLKALEECIALGRQAIFLVPEISLTSWPVKYLAAMFPDMVAVLHSSLSDGERYDEWMRIRDGKAAVVVGARSALFAPLKNIGLIIVDEEHESAYKQEDGVRYNARDSSLMMAKMLNSTVVLGSATPSIETFYNAKTGKIKLLHLTKRVEDRQMPEIELVDMRNNKGQGASGKGQEKNENIFSERLQNLMYKNHELGRQTILFLNRRGFSNFLICNDCGYSFQCLNCNVSLVMHKSPHPPFAKGGQGGILKCHYCDMAMQIPDICPKCRSFHIKPIGIGTEQLEQEARKMLHWARVARMDRDTTTKKRAHQKILDAVLQRDVDILVGTQMVAKGHHFPDVTLVGIVSADTSINIPDFRSSERTFQIITQAAGRAGRGDSQGKVIIQTLNPDHFCLKCAARQNYEVFFEEELNNRKELFYPPFSRLALIRFEASREADVEAAAKTAKRVADHLLESGFKKNMAVFGPAPAFFSKLKGKYRRQMLLKGKNTKPLHDFTAGFLKGLEKKHNRVNIIVDIDPANTV